MAIKIRIPKSGGEGGGATTIRGLPRDPVLRAALVAFLVLAVSFTIDRPPPGGRYRTRS